MKGEVDLSSFLVTLGVRFYPAGIAEITDIQVPMLANIRFAHCRDPKEYFGAEHFKMMLRSFILERPGNFYLCAIDTVTGAKAEAEVDLSWPDPGTKEIVDVPSFPVKMAFKKDEA